MLAPSPWFPQRMGEFPSFSLPLLPAPEFQGCAERDCGGGMDSLLKPAPFSRMGPVEWSTVELDHDHLMPGGYLKPDVVAFPGPGHPILAYPDRYLDPSSRIRGNSLRGRQAAGVAALMLSVHPGPEAEFGAGLIDAAAACRESVRPSGRS